MYKYSGKYRIRSDRKGGFQISRDGMNPMPGATGGFKDHRNALIAIQCLEHVGGEEHSENFWRLYHRVTGVTQCGRDMRERMAKSMGYRIQRTGRYTYNWVPNGAIA